ncbi:MAG: efflux RND transporter permease subunit [Pseudomonadota bacterium]|nr:efflux RND transporter permease subunit [Pseudomonadota bacterium]
MPKPTPPETVVNLSRPFILRPVATTLLTLGIFLVGLVAFFLLPVSPLPQVDFPVISVAASLPGANPENMAATVATPLERALGRIAGINEMTSQSTLGNTRINAQFDLARNIDGAARDVQAAINAARTLLPTGLPSNPSYHKFNPADAPIMVMALTSGSLSQGQLYDAASTILAQKLSQIDGVGQVQVGGSSLPAVRVDVNPQALARMGLSMEAVRATVVQGNVNRPKGVLEEGDRRWQIQANDQAMRARDYRPMIVAWRNGAPVRLQDVGTISDSVQDIRNAGLFNGKDAVLLIISRQPGANIISTVDRVTALMPVLRAEIPPAATLSIVIDRTPTIRASLRDVERTLVISTVLVIGVVFLFLRSLRATLVPMVVVPASLIGTFAVMYLLHYSLDNLSLMALTVATGFVVDDAIVVLENIQRHIEGGQTPVQAALRGAREVGFTVLSISLSLIAVFLPILAMGGLVGRLFREFAVVLSAAILVSLLVSLTTTPMICGRLLRRPAGPVETEHGAAMVLARTGGAFGWLLRGYAHSLEWALRHRRLVLVGLLATVSLNIWLYTIVPKGFFPQQDTGRLIGQVQADQSISFQAMREKLARYIAIIGKDPAVENVIGFTGGGQRNGATVFVALREQRQRKLNADAVINRLRKPLAMVPGASIYLQSVQDLRVGGRPGNAQYQYTLQGEDLDQLKQWAPRILADLQQDRRLADVSADQQDRGLSNSLHIDRDSASRLGITPAMIDAVLGDSYGQRQISVIYNTLNQYQVVLGSSPDQLQSQRSLDDTYIVTAAGLSVPLRAIATRSVSASALTVNHQGQFAATTFSFNLAPGVALGEATKAIDGVMNRLGVPATIIGGFQGTAKVFQDSLANQPLLLVCALLAIYIVLGILYESLIHPVTILSTLPSAGVGALLALLASHVEFNLIALIGVILLIGIVKKNAIIMIDFALSWQREHQGSAFEAIREACILRFRPIMMTTAAAMLGAVPLAVGFGEGAELRQPLGISIVGGLLVSQLLTLYTTPVVYLYLDRLRRNRT